MALKKRLWGYLALARISNSPTVVSNTLVGLALAGMHPSLVASGLVALAMVMFYTAGMYLNDVMDYHFDCQKRPERPLPSGVITRTEALAITFVLFIIGSVLLLAVGLFPFGSGLVLIALIIGYDAWHKSNPLSPLVMAACRLMVYVTAFLAVSTDDIARLLLPGGLLVSYLVGLTCIAKAENKPSVANAGVVALLFLPTLYFSTTLTLLSLPLLILFTGWVVYSVTFVLQAQRQIGRAVGQLIAGIALLDALVLTTHLHLVSVVVALSAFLLTLSFQRSMKGT